MKIFGRITGVVAGATCISMLLFSCTKDRDNPFDPENPDTQGSPLALTAQLSQEGVGLAWTPVEGININRFRVFRDIAPLQEWVLLDSVGGDERKYTDTQLTQDGEYYYCISAVGDDGKESALSRSASATVARSHTWSPLGGGIDGYVNALTVYNGQLIVGGGFDMAGGVSARNIAAWDGNSWTPLGTGVNASVFDLAVYDGKLIAAGPFSEAGGASVAYIASWNGSYWAAMGSYIFPSDYLDSPVNCLMTHGGRLYAGGSFMELVAYWDGATFTFIGGGLGGGYDHWANDFTIYRNHLVAGGYFSLSVRGLAEWYENDKQWQPFMFSNIFTSVDALTVYNDQLIVGGTKFVSPIEDSMRIVTWNNFSLSYLASQETGYVSDLINYNGRLIAGGSFDALDGTQVSNIAAWDGVEWHALGIGAGDYYVRALTVYEGKLIVGGQFTTAGGEPANNIAAWFEWPSK
jgi:hypothetical protein